MTYHVTPDDFIIEEGKAITNKRKSLLFVAEMHKRFYDDCYIDPRDQLQRRYTLDEIMQREIYALIRYIEEGEPYQSFKMEQQSKG